VSLVERTEEQKYTEDKPEKEYPVRGTRSYLSLGPNGYSNHNIRVSLLANFRKESANFEKRNCCYQEIALKWKNL